MKLCNLVSFCSFLLSDACIIYVEPNLFFYRKKNWRFFKVLGEQILEELANLKLECSIETSAWKFSISHSILQYNKLFPIYLHQLSVLLIYSWILLTTTSWLNVVTFRLFLFYATGTISSFIFKLFKCNSFHWKFRQPRQNEVDKPKRFKEEN